MPKTQIFDRRGTLLLLGTLGGLLILASHFPAFSQGKEDCAAKLQEARSKFDNADFADAIVLARECLQKDLTDSARKDAYELLAQVYLADQLAPDARNEAESAVRKLLELFPDYEAPKGARTLATLVGEVRVKMQPPVGRLEVSVEPPEASDAEVFVREESKDRLKGKAPLFLDLLIGEHKILARKEGFKEALQSVNVQARSTQQIRFRLEMMSRDDARLAARGTWGSVRNISGIAGILAGGAAVAFKVSANNSYDQYVAATNTEEAVSARQDTEKYQNLYKASLGVATGLLVVAATSWIIQGSL
jgi:hypothetical protein